MDCKRIGHIKHIEVLHIGNGAANATHHINGLLPYVLFVRNAPAFWGAEKRAEMLPHPCILRGPKRQAHGEKAQLVPNKGEQNHQWLPQPCLLGGPEDGVNATSPPPSRAPRRVRHPRILGDPQQRGAKSEVAASPPSSRGPERGQKCYVTLNIWGSQTLPIATRGNKMRSGP